MHILNDLYIFKVIFSIKITNQIKEKIQNDWEGNFKTVPFLFRDLVFLNCY